MVKKTCQCFSETRVLFYFHKGVKKQENMKYIELNFFSLKNHSSQFIGYRK